MTDAVPRDFTGPTRLPSDEAILAAIPHARHGLRTIRAVLTDYLVLGPDRATERAPVSRRCVERWVETVGLTRTWAEAKRFACVRRMADAVGETHPHRALARFAADWDAGESYAVLCQRYGVTSATVARIARRLGLVMRGRAPGRPARRTCERSRRAAAARQLKAARPSITGREIAGILGVSRASVSNYLRAA